MTYFAQTLPQNALSQTPSTVDPQDSGATVNQELTPQNSTSTFSLGSQSSTATLLNTSSQAGIQLSGVTSETVATELDTSTPAQSPPFLAIGIGVVLVVVCVLIFKYAPKK